MDIIIQEKISADHLLYVSLKYTKTTDVILNLISRWASLVELSIAKLLEKAVKEKKLKEIPIAPRPRIEVIKKIYRRDKELINTIPLYEFFRRIPNLEKVKEQEFRKHVNLKIKDKGEWVEINMDQLKEYAEIIEIFFNRVKKLID